MGFIETFVDTMKLVYDAPDKFLDSSALSLISTFAGRKAVINTGINKSIVDIAYYTMNSSGSYLNLWYMLIGTSRESRKSTVLNIVREFIQCIRKDMLIPPGFSPEKLTQILSERSKEERPEALWIYDECSGFFENIQRQYMLSTKEILSNIYNCKYYGGNITLSRGKNEVEQSYLGVLMAGTEYVPTLFDEKYMHQGFANRFIYVHDTRKEFKPKETSVPLKYEKNIKKLISWLKKLDDNKDKIQIIFNDDALDLTNKFGKEIDERIQSKEDDLIYQGWLGNMPDYVDKLSAICCLSDFFNENNEDDLMELLQKGIANIEKEHVQKAIDRMWESFKDYKKIIQIMNDSKRKKNTMSLNEQENLIKQVIRSSPNKEIPRTELKKQIRNKIKNSDDILDGLVDRGILEIFEIRTLGRPKIIYKIKT